MVRGVESSGGGGSLKTRLCCGMIKQIVGQGFSVWSQN